MYWHKNQLKVHWKLSKTDTNCTSRLGFRFQRSNFRAYVLLGLPLNEPQNKTRLSNPVGVQYEELACTDFRRLTRKIEAFLGAGDYELWGGLIHPDEFSGEAKNRPAMSNNACCSCCQFSRRDFRSWLRPVVISIYFVILCVALPLTVWELHKNRAQTHVQAWFVAGCFVFLTIPISLWGILQHLVNYTKPELQRRIVR